MIESTFQIKPAICNSAPSDLRAAYAASLLICLAIPPIACAQSLSWSATPIAQPNGAQLRTPLSGQYSKRHQLAVDVDARWTNRYGYRPIRVEVSTPNPASRDRKATVRIVHGWYESIIIEQDLTLAAGSTRAVTTVRIPQYEQGSHLYYWDIWIDGVKDKELSLTKEDAIRLAGGGYGTTSGIAFLAIGPASNARKLVAPNSLDFEIFTLPIDRLPEHWLDYTCFDVVSLTVDELVTLADQHPRVLAAIEAWLRAGGQVWIDDVGREYEQVAQVSSLLALDSSLDPSVIASDNGETDSEAEDAPPGHFGWEPTRFGTRNSERRVVQFRDNRSGETREARGDEEIQQLQSDPNYSVIESPESENENEDNPRWRGDSGEWFVDQGAGLGRVRAFRELSEIALFHQSPPANPNTNDESVERMPRSMWTALRSSERWDSRHGVLPDQGSREFVDLLVPNVGLAPVTEFRVLITLFVLLIGPVNYWILKRINRLHLLVLSVPLAAGLMTIALVAYAIVADGFQTVVRAHSYTVLDQTTGSSSSWARLSYYSGLAPSEGLTLPDDIAIYPIHPTWDENRYQEIAGTTRTLRWENNKALLTSGWLRSRTPTQYLTIRSRTSPMRLELAATNDKLRVTNRLRTSVNFLLVVDRDEDLWIGEGIEENAMAFLEPIERTEAVQRFRDLVLKHEPQPPPAFGDGNLHYARLQQRQRQSGLRSLRGRLDETQIATNLANESIGDLAGLLGDPGLRLPARSYLAVTHRAPEVEYGLSNYEETASFHLLVGHW